LPWPLVGVGWFVVVVTVWPLVLPGVGWLVGGGDVVAAVSGIGGRGGGCHRRGSLPGAVWKFPSARLLSRCGIVAAGCRFVSGCDVVAAALIPASVARGWFVVVCPGLVAAFLSDVRRLI